MKITLLITLAITSILVACTSNEAAPKKAIVENAHPHDLNLNEGEKWKVVPEMLKSIRTMEFEVNNFKGTTSSEFKNYGKRMSELINDLTSSCTMEGEAHDELHKWLIPFIELNDALIKSDSIEQSSELVVKQKKEIKRFNTYFE